MAIKRGGQQPAAASLCGDTPQGSPFSGAEPTCCREGSMYPNFSGAIGLNADTMQTFMGCACVLKASFMACALTSAPSPEVHAKECLPAGCLLNKRMVYQFQRTKPAQPVLRDWQVM